MWLFGTFDQGLICPQVAYSEGQTYHGSLLWPNSLNPVSGFKMDHRGPFQAQGEGLEESESWNEEHPLQALKGHHLLSGLQLKIPAREAAIRRDSFIKAHRFIDSAASSCGVTPCKKSFPVRGSRSGRRVDIEVLSGLAFV